MGDPRFSGLLAGDQKVILMNQKTTLLLNTINPVLALFGLLKQILSSITGITSIFLYKDLLSYKRSVENLAYPESEAMLKNYDVVDHPQ